MAAKAMSGPASLDIIIVNFNTGPQVRQCLSSICASRQDGIYALSRVVVVDNASRDGSLDDLAYPDLPLQIIRNSSNRGFAAASNQGAAGSEADYLLFLNPDTRLLPDTLARSVEWMNAADNARVGILGVQMLEDNGHVARSCARFPTTGRFIAKMFGLNKLFPRIFPDHFYREWDHTDSRYVDQVIGAYFFIRRSVFEWAGRFDERFFLYFEEVDLSLKALRAGWLTYYLASVQCYHSGGAATNQIKAQRLFHVLRSRILFAFKYFGVMSAMTLLVATMLIEPVSRMVQAAARGSMTEMREVLHAYYLLWGELPRILRSRYLRTAQPVQMGLEVLPGKK
jgi:N-acetylglucosaminyl-diphospho-decaprenol L-rhamnosyltransferase